MPVAPQEAEVPAFVPPPRMPSAPEPSWQTGFDTVEGPPGALEPVEPVTSTEEAVPLEPPDELKAPAPESESPALELGTAPGPAPRTEPGTGPAVAASAATEPAPVMAATDGDWLGTICPYLLSEDGTYRSAQPDETHRCTAQEPDGTLPLAFQERFCLSDRHVRCEVYKYAQETRAATLAEGGVAVEQVQSARFKPAVRSMPVALAGPDLSGAGGASRRPAVIGAIALGVLVIIVFVTVLLTGGDGGEDPTVAGAGSSPAAGATTAPAATDEPAAEATSPVAPTPAATADPDSTPGDPTSAGGPQLVSYQVQEGEALLKIAETFGTTRRSIIQANEGMADKTPYVAPGDLILVPAASEMTIEELEAVAGFLGLAE